MVCFGRDDLIEGIVTLTENLVMVLIPTSPGISLDSVRFLPGD